MANNQTTKRFNTRVFEINNGKQQHKGMRLFQINVLVQHGNQTTNR